jgi:hypothetical protein
LLVILFVRHTLHIHLTIICSFLFIWNMSSSIYHVSLPYTRTLCTQVLLLYRFSLI